MLSNIYNHYLVKINIHEVSRKGSPFILWTPCRNSYDCHNLVDAVEVRVTSTRHTGLQFVWTRQQGVTRHWTNKQASMFRVCREGIRGNRKHIRAKTSLQSYSVTFRQITITVYKTDMSQIGIYSLTITVIRKINYVPGGKQTF